MSRKRRSARELQLASLHADLRRLESYERAAESLMEAADPIFTPEDRARGQASLESIRGSLRAAREAVSALEESS